MIFQSIKEYVCIRLLAHKNVLFATIITKGQSYCLVTRSTKQTVHCSRVSAERTLSSKNEGPRSHHYLLSCWVQPECEWVLISEYFYFWSFWKNSSKSQEITFCDQYNSYYHLNNYVSYFQFKSLRAKFQDDTLCFDRKKDI